MAELVKIDKRAGRLTLTLARPEIRNALNDELIEQLLAAITAASDDPVARVIVLAGEGRSFCAGADLNWMKNVASGSFEDNKQGARRLVVLLDAIVDSPRPVIARVHGAALGGGMGLVAACDLVVAHPRAKLGLTEVRLGLAPAMIFPYLFRRVQRHELLAAALFGEIFDAAHGKAIGLVNEVSEDIDGVLDKWVEALTACGPEALGEVKRLFDRVPALDRAAAADFTSDTIARLRLSAEGQEGMKAFLEKRPAAWVASRKADQPPNHDAQRLTQDDRAGDSDA